jgi:cytochrome c553
MKRLASLCAATAAAALGYAGALHAAYMVTALQAYKSGERKNPTMKAIAADLSDKDMADLGAYYATDSTRSAGK